MQCYCVCYRIVSDDWSRLLVARLLHALLACDTHSSIALQVTLVSYEL